MAIALQVLKIIGIVLLCVIGFFLVLILLLLFWPYGYRVRASKYDDFRAQAGITWLLHAVTADLLYEDGINFRIKLFGIPFYDKKRKEKKAAEREKKLAEKGSADALWEEDPEDKSSSDEGRTSSDREPIPSGEGTGATDDSQGNDAGEETGATDDSQGSGAGEGTGSAESREDSFGKETGSAEELQGSSSGEGRSRWMRGEEKRRKSKRNRKPAGRRQSSEDDRNGGKDRRSFSDWCEERLEWISDRAEALAGRIEDGSWQIGDTIDGAFDTYHYYERVLESEGTAWVVAYVKKHALAIIKPFKPRRFDLDLDYRSEDPVQIAKVMQYYALSIPLTDEIRGTVRVTALPEEDLIQGHTGLKGFFVLGPVLWHAFLLWKNRKVRHFIKVIKREQEPGGGKANGRKQK